MKFPILISYAYARKPDKQEDFEYFLNHPDVDVLLDSGAFTAKASGHEIRLDEYCEFLDTWRDKVFAYLALDVVGDPAATDANLREMIASGYTPAPVHVLGDSEAKLNELFEMSDYVALAGLKRPGKGHCPRSYVKLKMKWAAGRKVHWLGYVKEDMFQSYRPYSVDSSSWTYGLRFGWTTIYLGCGKWARKVQFGSRDELSGEMDKVIPHLRRLGFTADDWNNQEQWYSRKVNSYRGIPMATCGDSWVRYVVDIYRHYGTRVFMATSLASGDRKMLEESIDAHHGSIIEAEHVNPCLGHV